MNTRAYRSKIGRLPFALRCELNERIRDGARAEDILGWLNAAPECARAARADGRGPVSAQNLTDWRGTGYRDWLADQAQADRVRKAAEAAAALTEAAGCDPSEVAARIAAAALIETVTRPDDPKALSEAARAIAALRAADIGGQRARLAREKLALEGEGLALARERFRRETCELFLKWHADRRAAAIAEGGLRHEDKIRALLGFMDGEEAE